MENYIQKDASNSFEVFVHIVKFKAKDVLIYLVLWGFRAL